VGDEYYIKLSQELANFLEKSLDSKFGGILLLSELYCIFNRARAAGTLVSPEDLIVACDHFSTLNVPIQKRTFPSGTKIVQSSRFSDSLITQRLLNLTKSTPYVESGITAFQISHIEKLPVALVREFLQLAVNAGSLCIFVRAGVGEWFYPNWFDSIADEVSL